jgi:hypothetical protein
MLGPDSTWMGHQVTSAPDTVRKCSRIFGLGKACKRDRTCTASTNKCKISESVEKPYYFQLLPKSSPCSVVSSKLTSRSIELCHSCLDGLRMHFEINFCNRGRKSFLSRFCFEIALREDLLNQVNCEQEELRDTNTAIY